MQRLFLPLSVLLVTCWLILSELQKGQTKLTREHTAVAALERTAASTNASNTELAGRTKAATVELAQASEFLNEWQLANARSSRGGLEANLLELASRNEVNMPTPRSETTGAFLPGDNLGIKARVLTVHADGTINALLGFFAEAERAMPLGSTQSFQLRASDRDPKMEYTIAVLERAFTPMPDLPPSLTPLAPAADPSGVLAIRPDTAKTAVPKLPDNLMVRGTVREATPTVSPTDLVAKLLPGMKVTCSVWDPVPEKRIIIANGLILRPAHYLPNALVKGSARVLLVEIAKDMFRVRIETSVFNSVTNKEETESVTRDIPFKIFPDYTSEG